MKRIASVSLVCLSILFVAQWGITGSVSPPATIWSNFQAISDVNMGTFSITNADTMAVNTSFNFPDGTTQNTSPQACASGEALNTSGCEAWNDSSGAQLSTYTIPLTSVPAGDSVALVRRINEQADIKDFGIQNNSQDTNEDWEVEIHDLTNRKLVDETFVKLKTSTDTIPSSTDVGLVVKNTSSETESLSAYMELTF